MINFEDFKKVELKVGKVIEAEKVDKSDKLLKLKVDLGPSNTSGQAEIRQIVAGIQEFYKPEDLLNKEIVIVANLEPRTMMGLESQGMLLAADVDGEAILLKPDKDVPPGAEIK